MKPRIDPSVAPPISIGIDIGKEIFHIVGIGADGKIAFRWKIRRLALKETFEKLPSSGSIGDILPPSAPKPALGQKEDVPGLGQNVQLRSRCDGRRCSRDHNFICRFP